MSTFYLVRHGERKLRKFAGLTSFGRRQAQVLGKALKEKNVGLIVSSPSQRTTETAELIGISLKKPYIIDERLRERFEYGEFEGQSYQDYVKDVATSNSNRSLILPNGQSSIAKAHQMTDLMNSLSDNNDSVALVTHAGTILDYLRTTFSYVELGNVIPDFSNWRDIYTPQASITTIKIEKGVCMLVEVGDISHLTEKA